MVQDTQQTQETDESASDSQRIGSGELNTAEIVRKELAKLDRTPFRRILIDYLGYAPTVAALKRFADKSPDRWIQGAVMLAQLSGYTKDTNVNVSVNISNASDAEVRQRLRDAEQGQLAMHSSRILPTPNANVLSPQTTRLNDPQIIHRDNADAIDVQVNEDSDPPSEWDR